MFILVNGFSDPVNHSLSMQGIMCDLTHWQYFQAFIIVLVTLVIEYFSVT